MSKRKINIRTQAVNANAHTPRGMGGLERSIGERGWIGAMTVAEDGESFDGSARLEVGAGKGWDFGADDIPIIKAEPGKPLIIDTDGSTPIIHRRRDIPTADDPRAKLLAIEANRIAELNLSWSPAVLAEIGETLDLSGLFNPDEMAVLLAEVQPEIEIGAGGDEFVATPQDGPTRCQLGDLWQIGPHRLIVGDCTDPAVVERLMGGERAQGCFTSPPYAEQRKEQYGGVPADEYVDWFSAVQENIAAHLAPDGSFFLNIKPHCEDGERVLYVFDLVLAMRRRWGWRFVDELCWLGNAFPGLRGPRFKNGFEPVYHFTRSAAPKFRPQNVVLDVDLGMSVTYDETGGGVTLATGKGGRSSGQRVHSKHFDGALPSNVIRAFQGAGSPEHVAVFPVSLPEFFINAYSDTDDIWLDLFGGSGTVLIAAYRLGRGARICELLPKYADVILRRAEAEGLTCERVSEG